MDSADATRDAAAAALAAALEACSTVKPDDVKKPRADVISGVVVTVQ